MLVFDHTSMRPEAGLKRHTAPAVSSGCALARCQRSRRRITRWAEAKPPATSPKLMVFSNTRLLGRLSCTFGAPGFIASIGSVSTGSGAYSTSIKAAASSAV
jgi:hypothetical protein